MTDKEQQLQDLALSTFKDTQKQFQPCYPWILIRVLPKSQLYKGVLILPEKQNKVTHEAIVLVTWKPRMKMQKIQNTLCEKEEKSEFTAGDYIMIPHWAGLPVTGLDEDLYRIIRESDIHGWLDIEEIPIQDKLKHLLDHESHMANSYVAKTISDRFVLVDKQQKSVTLSGA